MVITEDTGFSGMLIYRQKWKNYFKVWRNGTKITIEYIYFMASGKLCVGKGTALNMGKQQRGAATLQIKFTSGNPSSCDLVGPRHILLVPSGGQLSPRIGKFPHLKLLYTYFCLTYFPSLEN